MCHCNKGVLFNNCPIKYYYKIFIYDSFIYLFKYNYHITIKDKGMIWLSMVTRLNVKEMTEIKKKKINYTIAAIVEFIFILFNLSFPSQIVIYYERIQLSCVQIGEL